MAGLYGLSLVKQLGSYKWQNTYLVYGPSLSAVNAVLASFVTFETSFLSTLVTVVEGRVWGWRSTDPDDFIITPLADEGEQNFGSFKLCAPQQAVWMDLGCATGRKGKKFFRGSLRATDIDGDSGSLEYNGAAPTIGIANAAASDLMETLDGLGYELRVGWKPGHSGRAATSFTVAAHPASVNVHKRWYNVEPSP